IMTGKNSSYETGRAPCVAPGKADARPPGQSGVSITRPGPKIVLLRGRGAPGPAVERPGTGDLRFELQAPSDNLRSIKGGLERYSWERPGNGECRERERYQVSLWIRLVSERTAVLEGILLHMGTPSIVLTAVGAAEREALENAAKLLGRWIRDDEPFE